MHSLALQLAPVLAAEKSKVPFYIAGGVLVAWALIVSMALGMRRPEFPGGLSGQRAVSAVTIVLVIAAMSTAVLTSGVPSSEAEPVGSHTKGAGNTQTETQPAPAAPASTSTAPATTSATPTTTTAAPTATTRLSLAADPGGLLKFNTGTLHAKAGTVTIAFANQAPLEHNVTVAQGASVLGATPTFSGGSRTLTLTLKPGTYSFYCSVPGHRQAGMEGKLIVE
jgi:plastocyanin